MPLEVKQGSVGIQNRGLIVVHMGFENALYGVNMRERVCWMSACICGLYGDVIFIDDYVYM